MCFKSILHKSGGETTLPYPNGSSGSIVDTTCSSRFVSITEQELPYVEAANRSGVVHGVDRAAFGLVFMNPFHYCQVSLCRCLSMALVVVHPFF